MKYNTQSLHGFSKRMPLLGALALINTFLFAKDAAKYFDVSVSPAPLNFASASVYFIFFVYLAAALLFLLCSYKLLKGSEDSRSVVLIICGALLSIAVLRLMTFGMTGNEINFSIKFIIIVTILTGLNVPAVKHRFHPARLTFFSLVIGWILLVVTAVYGVMYLRYGLNTPSMEDGVLNVAKLDSAPEIPMPGSFSIMVPEEYFVAGVTPLEGGSCTVSFHSSLRGYIRVAGPASLRGMQQFATITGHAGMAGFIETVFAEKVGMFYILLKNIISPGAVQSYQKLTSGDITAFLEKPAEDNSYSRMLIFSGENFLGEISVISEKASDYSLQYRLLSTVRKNESLYTARQYYDISARAETLNQKMRAAAYAVIRESADPEYHLRFAELALQADNSKLAAKHVETAESLGADTDKINGELLKVK